MNSKIDYSFKVLEEILTFNEYNSREEVIEVGKMMVEKVLNKDCSQDFKNLYIEGFKKVDSLSFDEMKQIITILTTK